MLVDDPRNSQISNSHVTKTEQGSLALISQRRVLGVTCSPDYPKSLESPILLGQSEEKIREILMDFADQCISKQSIFSRAVSKGRKAIPEP
jgi:hypothetical protein